MTGNDEKEIPPTEKIPQPEEELSLEELEQASGGVIPWGPRDKKPSPFD